MSGISTSSMSGIQQGMQLLTKAADRVNEASQNKDTEGMTAGMLDAKDAQIQTQAAVSGISGEDSTFQSIIDLFA